MQKDRISVIGLGKVGITLAVNLANSGSDVIGFDLNEELISDIKCANFKTYEPQVQNLLTSSLNKNLFVTDNIEKAILTSDISFVIVPTPSNLKGGFSNLYVLNAVKMMARILPKKTSKHTISIVSTMLPGSSDSQIIPAIEKESGLKVIDDFGYCYNPAFIALGEIVKGFSEPDFVLIGESDKKSGDTILNAIKGMLKYQPPISRMSLIEAELTKIASNTHETMRVSFVNMLMNICTEVPNTNVDNITNALSHRMGSRFFKGATPYGGPCWPRDNVALSQFMKLLNSSAILPEAIHLSNQKISSYIIKKIQEQCESNLDISVIGLAYKNGTPITEESFALKLCESMVKKGYEVHAWDPLISSSSNEFIEKGIKIHDSIKGCIEKTKVIILANPLKEINLLNWAEIKDPFVIDCWRYLSKSNKKHISKYFGLGLNPDEDVQKWILENLGNKYNQLTK